MTIDNQRPAFLLSIVNFLFLSTCKKPNLRLYVFKPKVSKSETMTAYAHR